MAKVKQAEIEQLVTNMRPLNFNDAMALSAWARAKAELQATLLFTAMRAGYDAPGLGKLIDQFVSKVEHMDSSIGLR